MYHVTATNNRLFAYTTVTGDLLLLAEKCTTWLGLFLPLVFLSVMIGVPVQVAGACVVAVGALIVVTKPLLMFADRSIPRLLDTAAELVDLDLSVHTVWSRYYLRLNML
jgi:hypothetical protein